MEYSCPKCKGNLKSRFRLLNLSNCPFCQCDLRLNKTKLERNVHMISWIYLLAYFISDYYKAIGKPILVFSFLCLFLLTHLFFEYRTNNVPRYVEGAISPDEISQKKSRFFKIILVLFVVNILGILIALSQT